MRGKIRVYARIRPMSKSEKENADRNARCYKILDEMSLSIDPESKMAQVFNFDAVYGEDSR